MSKPFFSIIIPTLNEEVALPELLVDLGEQTFANFEVIIVDGQSTDQTQARALGFSQKLNLQFLKAPTRGVASQRNFGANAAGADYFIFLDADTRIPADFLASVKDMVNLKNPDLLTTWIKTDEDGVKPIETGTNLIFEISKSLGVPALYGSMIVVKAQSFNKVGGFKESLKFREDTDLAQRLYKKGYKYVILRSTYYYWSLRRFRRLGMIKTLQKYLLLNLGKTLDYPMGGGAFATKGSAAKFNQFVERLIKKFQLE